MNTIAPDILELAPEELQQLKDWVPVGAGFRVVLTHSRSSGAWYATVLDFNLAGMGDTRDEAFQEMFEIMVEYLVAFMRDGGTYDDAIRRVPASRRAKYFAHVGMTKALSRLLNHRDGASKWEIPFGAPHLA